MSAIHGRSRIERKLGKRDHCKLEYATYARRDKDGVLYVRHHTTDTVIHYPDGSVKLYNGGYYTMTTRTRMETYSGLSIRGGIVTQRSDGTERAPWEVYTGVDSALYHHHMLIPADGSLQEYKDQWHEEWQRRRAAYV